jgi:hypothetical protein
VAEDVLSALRFTGEHTSRLERIERLVSGMIAAHSIHPSLHRVLQDVPRGKMSKSVHQKFESEYSNLYTKLVAAIGRSGLNPRSEIRPRCSPQRWKGWCTTLPAEEH